MASPAKKVTSLPRFTLTQVDDGPATNAARLVSDPPREDPLVYSTVSRVNPETGRRHDGKPQWVAGTYRHLHLSGADFCCPMAIADRARDGRLWTTTSQRK